METKLSTKLQLVYNTLEYSLLMYILYKEKKWNVDRKWVEWLVTGHFTLTKEDLRLRG